MRLLVAACSLVVVAGACASDETLDPPATRIRGGTRLRPTFFRAEGGARLAAGWRDSALAVDCTFAESADGALRCLPLSPESEAPGLLFADAACTQPVLEGPPRDGFVWRFVRRCPRPAASVFRVGARLPLAAVHVRNNGTCNPRQTSEEVHALEEATGLFVRADEEATASGGLAPVMVQAEDGARALTGWRHGELGLPCAFEVLASGDLLAASDGSVRCLPAAAAAPVASFADPACSLPVVRDAPGTCPGPVVSGARDDRRCPPRVQLHRAGDPVAAVFTLKEGTCAPALALAAHRLQGEPIDPQALGAARLAVGPGLGRVRSRFVVTESGVERLASGWDRDLEGPCRPLAVQGGSVRCVPTSHVEVSTTWFQDARCERPLGVPRETKACAARFAIEWTDAGAPRRVLRVRHPYAGAVFARSVDGCHPAEGAVQPIYALGDEVPLVALPPLAR